METIKTIRSQHHQQANNKPSFPHADDIHAIANAEAIQSSSSSFSRLNSNHKARAARIDGQLQRKVLSRSVIAESLDYFLPKAKPSLVRTVSDSRKLSKSEVGLMVSKAKPDLNPEKERWRRKFYGGEIVKMIYDTSKEKKTRRNAEQVNGVQPQQQQKLAPEEDEPGEQEDAADVKKRLAKLEIVEVKKIGGVRKDSEGDLKRVSRRRSFCGEETSLSSFLSSNGARIVAVDMPPFMQIHAIDCARKAYDSLEKFTSKSLALSLKKEFDGVYGPAWHCIVGTSFGSFVTHSVGGFLYFSLDHKMYILLFKTTVQRAD